MQQLWLLITYMYIQLQLVEKLNHQKTTLTFYLPIKVPKLNDLSKVAMVFQDKRFS